VSRPSAQLLDEGHGVGAVGGVEDLLFGGVLGAVGDVGADGAGENHGFLRDSADLLAQAFGGVLGDIEPVDEDPAGVGVEEPGDEREECGFARAVGPDEGDALAVNDLDGDVAERGAIGTGVGEGDAFERDGSFVPGQVGQALARAGLGLEGHEFLDAFARGGGGLDLVDDAGERPQRRGGHADGDERDHKVRRIELVVEHGLDGDGGEDADAGDRDHLGDGARHGAGRARLEQLAHHAPVGLLEALDFAGLGGLHLDDAQAPEHVARAGEQLGLSRVGPLARPADTLPQRADDQEQQRPGDERHDRDQRLEDDRHGERREALADLRHALAEDGCEAHGEQLGLFDDAPRQVGRVAGDDRPQREADHVLERAIADALRGAVHRGERKILVTEGGERAEHRQRADADHDHDHAAPRAGREHVDHRLRHLRLERPGEQPRVGVGHHILERPGLFRAGEHGV
jgi:hypothetical protein